MEETEGKLNELGQRISAIEKAQLQSLELIQGEPLTKDKIEELKKSREEQVESIIRVGPKMTVPKACHTLYQRTNHETLL